jgi:hypothetical protein
MPGSIQSSDYVPGVSGWKIDPVTGQFELASDRVTVSGVDPKAVYSGKTRKESSKPFVVVDGVTYINEAFIKEGSIASPRLASWVVNMKVGADGKYVAAGLGLGIEVDPGFMPDIIVKASHMEILQDGLVKITQAAKKAWQPVTNRGPRH